MKVAVRDEKALLSMYLNNVNNESISDDQDVQRAFCWDNSMINELVYTVLSGHYIPPIILAEVNLENNMVQQYIVDGMQRTSALNKFKNLNHKLTTLENSIIEYQVRKMENGRVVKDENNAVVWETKTYDLKNKTFSDLPQELKDKFDSYQLRAAIHQDCTIPEISRLVRRYNFHKSMNTSQKAFTYIDLYARKIKTIVKGQFFKDAMKVTDSMIKSGVREQLVCDCVMAVNFMDKWNNKPIKRNTYLNENANEDMFVNADNLFNRITDVCEDNYQDIFVAKDIPVWVAVFEKFVNTYGLEDTKFVEFLDYYKANQQFIDTFTHFKTEKNSTKAKSVIVNKMEYLLGLIEDYFNVNANDFELDVETEIIEEVINEAGETFEEEPVELEDVAEDVAEKVKSIDKELEFIRDNVFEEASEEDLADYEEDLEILSLSVDNNSLLLEAKNKLSLLGIIAYSYVKDIIIDDWFINFFDRIKNYDPDQKQNYEFMVADLEKYIA